MTPLIAITGGIGSGKSAICRCLAAWGYNVYDCDARAKALMDRDREIHRRLCGEISADVVKEGVIDRQRLASIVFYDPAMLAALNGIVHHRVIEDLRLWRERHSRERLLFVESAILLESNLHCEVDRVWLVDAREETCLRRASRRDSSSPEKIRARMANQRRVTPGDITVPLDMIDNDGCAPVIPQLRRLLQMANGTVGGARSVSGHDEGLTANPGQWKS